MTPATPGLVIMDSCSFPRPEEPINSSRGLADGKWEVKFHSGAGTAHAPVGLGDGDIVDAGLAATHEAFVIEFPKFVAVAAPPLSCYVVAFVLEPHRDPVATEAPQLLA